MSRSRNLAISLVGCAAALLAATTVLAATLTAVPRCDGVRLRTGPSTSYQTKLVIDRSATVTIVDEVGGAKWSTLCGDGLIAGSRWAKISAVDGRLVESRFGVEYLYAAAGLLREAAGAGSPTTPPATPRPTATAPATSPPSEPPATATPPSSSSPSPSPSAGPWSSPEGTSPDPSPSASTRPVSPASQGPAGPLSGSSLAVEILVLVLALVSTALSTVALGARHRRRQQRVMADVPTTRLDDILS